MTKIYLKNISPTSYLMNTSCDFITFNKKFKMLKLIENYRIIKDSLNKIYNSWKKLFMRIIDNVKSL